MPVGDNPSKHSTGCEFIRNKIKSGEWPPGHKLPSQAAWASGTPGMELKYGTLRGVYLTLKTERWIEGQQGEGVFVSEHAPIPVAVKSTQPRTAKSKPLTRKDRS